jgi:hypothetical protein
MQPRSDTVYGGVIRLGTAAGENHLSRTAVEDSGHSFSGFVQRITGFLTH